MNVMNAITNQFFNTYYQAYKQIVDNYQTQSKNINQGNLEQKSEAAAQSATNATNQQEVKK